jgi:FkbH-like protein
MNTADPFAISPRAATAAGVKCVVWDLDRTLWDGILLESPDVALRPGVVGVLETLDERGILQSIASRNDPDTAMDKLRQLGVDQFFLHPQIGWGAKSAAVSEIGRLLNIGVDTIAFVDDEPFERDEVAAGVPGVRSIDSATYLQLTERPDMQPRFVTADSRRRREMYLAESRRRDDEDVAPTSEEFLASLDMVFTLSHALEGDLARVAELTVRTNQLNTTGVTYTYEELEALRTSDRHQLIIAGLEDRYGTYGKIGLVLIEERDDVWNLSLLLMSCRVMTRGVGKVLLSYVLDSAADHGATVEADFVRTDRNRLMYLTYKLAGFREVHREGDRITFRHDPTVRDPYPPYVRVVEPRRLA